MPPGGLQAYHASIAEDSADGQLAASAAWTLADLAAAAQQLAASRDLSTAEAELAAANLALLQAGGSGEAGEGSSGSTAQRRHVWYGDPLLSTGETRHSVEVRRTCVLGMRKGVQLPPPGQLPPCIRAGFSEPAPASCTLACSSRSCPVSLSPTPLAGSTP